MTELGPDERRQMRERAAVTDKELEWGWYSDDVPRLLDALESAELGILLSRDEVRQLVRLVYVAEGEGRASAADWALAQRLAADCGFPPPAPYDHQAEDDDDVQLATQEFYWPRS